MKTFLPALLVVFLGSCSQPPPASFQPWGPSAQQKENTAVAAAPAESAPVHAPATNPAPQMAQANAALPAAGAVPQSVVITNRITGLPVPQDVVITNRQAGVIDTNAIAAQRAAMIAAQITESQPQPTPFPLASEAQTNAAPPASSQPATAGGEETVPIIQFPAAPLDQVLKVYAQLVNRTVLRAANLSSPPITLETQTPLTKKEAIQALDAVLALNGVAMINVDDKFVKAVPLAQANTDAAQWSSNDVSTMPELGQYETRIVQLHYVKPTTMVQTLSTFAKNPAALLGVDDSQILVIRDYTPNVKRMLELIKKIDVPVESEFTSEVIPIKYAQAKAIADALSSLSSGGGAVTTVNDSILGSGRGGGAGNPFRSGLGGGGASPYGGYNQPGMGGYTPQATVAPVPAPVPAPAANPSFTQRLRDIINQSGGPNAMQILGQTKIIADERSNSLLIFATKQDMDMIKNVVSKLDVVLTQVLIETVIMDVSLDNGWNYSVSAAQEPTFSHNPTVATAGAMRNNTPFLDFINAAATNAFALGSLPGAGGFNYWAKIGKSFDLALQAGASDNRVNVIQKPQILTTHAKAGSIFVGSTVPYVTSSSYGGVYGGGNSYQQLRVGIGLQVTPYINPDGLVVMHIDESIDEISGSTHIDNVGDVPNTTSRTISADVAVRDGDGIMLGGFIRNASNKLHSGIPILKDIPLLGALFSSQSSSKQRSELIVLMRPTVLRTPEIAAVASTAEKQKLPGVMGAERELQSAERKAMEHERNEEERARKEAFEHEPVTPEERRAYGQP